MGVRFPSVQSTTIVTAAPAAGTESVLCTTPGLNLPIDSAAVLLFGYAAIITGATITAIQLNLRRGTTVAGTLINIAQNTLVGSATKVLMPIVYFDTPGIVAEQQWSLCGNFVGAGASTTTDVCLIAFAL